MIAAFSGADWLALLVHFLSLSLLAIGGAITTAPEMHSYLVNEKSWLTDSQFTSSIALAQAAPGPNVLFIALLGWNVGMNAAARWGHRNRERRAVRAFKQGMAPIVVALLVATGWILASSHGEPLVHWRLWLLSAATTVLVWQTRIHLLWLLGAGAVLGALGYL